MYNMVIIVNNIVVCGLPRWLSSKESAYNEEDLIFFINYFLLKDNCFKEVCCFLSNLNMDQP